jgi:hypothetical protein
MKSLDIKLNLLQTKVYYLLGELLGIGKNLSVEERNKVITIVELIDEELNKFIKSFSEKK